MGHGVGNVVKRILHKIVLPLGILVGGGLVFFVLVSTKPTPGVEPGEQQAWLINAAQVYPKSYVPHVVLYGRVESPHTADIESVVTANVLATPALEGEFIYKNELLIQLEEEEVNLLLLQRKADVKDLDARIKTELLRYRADQEALEFEKGLVKLAKTNLSRREYLEKTKAGSVAQLDEAKQELRKRQLLLTTRALAVEQHHSRLAQLQAQLDRAKAQFNQAQLDFTRTKILSPFDGRVAKLFVAVGERVRPGTQLIKVYNIERVEVRAQIPLQYLKRLHEITEHDHKLTAKGTVDGKDFSLELDRLSGEVTKGRAGIDGLFRVVSGGKYLALGRTVDFNLDLPTLDGVFAIPLSALYKGNRVYKVVDDHLQAVTVERVGIHTLADQKKVVLIKSQNIQPKDWLMTNHLPNAVTGLFVKINKEP